MEVKEMSHPEETVFRVAGVCKWMACVLFVAAAASGCTTTVAPDVVTEDPYQSCEPGDDCSGGLTCSPTTLPASTGYTGDFCTSSCGSASDCLQVPDNFTAQCVNGQCYLTCPTGSGSCPYDQQCLTFDDQNGNAIDLCTP
jgi:hypothetical protein